MIFLGIDIGTSSIKVSAVDAASQITLASVQYPETEAEIISLKPGWAEQDPETWWDFMQKAILKANASGKYNPKDITAIGIAYQMHGLVLVDKEGELIRNSIIWCDSRAVDIGEEANKTIGHEFNLVHHLNSPGNFTASKLAWVKANEPGKYAKIDTVMLPGEYIAFKFTGQKTTTNSSLSEGIFWDFKENRLSPYILNHFGFSDEMFPEIKPVFGNHGEVSQAVCTTLGFAKGVQVTYKAGDQPNNAFSLNVLEPGEVAATAGTSGVIYGVADSLVYDQQSRVNTFAHVNHSKEKIRTGVLLCINGTGILYSWAKRLMGKDLNYSEVNRLSSSIPLGSEGLSILPFGNGAERILNNKVLGSSIEGIDFNRHTASHIYKAIQEGLAFAFRYGLDIMRENGMQPSVIKAGHSNLFLSEVFQEDFVGATGVAVKLYNNDGSVGAALGAGIGAGYYKDSSEAFKAIEKIAEIQPENTEQYDELYQKWKETLNNKLQ